LGGLLLAVCVELGKRSQHCQAGVTTTDLTFTVSYITVGF
jgi:hypothetical protein